MAGIDSQHRDLGVDRSSEGLQLDKTANGLFYDPPQPRHGKDGNRATGNTIPYGLSVVASALTVALVSAVIVGAAVGGGVGGAWSSSRSSSSSHQQPASSVPTSTVSSTTTLTISAGQTLPTTDLQNFTVALPQDVDTLSWSCPEASSYSTVYLDPNQQFQIYCGVDFRNGAPAVGGGVVADIFGVVAYSAADCMTACASFNKWQSRWTNSTRCAGITFSQVMSLMYVTWSGNCWLKNGTAINPVAMDTAMSAIVIVS